MKTLDLFIFVRFLLLFTTGLTVLISLFLSIDIMTNLNRFDVSISVLIFYYIYYIPYIIYNMIPVSALVALIALVSTLVRTSELVAFNALGYSLLRVLRTVFCFIFGLFLFLIWSSDALIPHFMEKRNYIYFVEMKKRPDGYMKNKRKNIWYRTRESIIFFGQVLDNKNVEGVKIYFIDEQWNLNRFIEAETLSMKSSVWLLKQVKNSQMSLEQEIFQVSHYESLEIPALTELESMKMSGNATDYLSTSDLLSLIKKNKKIALDTSRLRVTLFSKYAFALTVIILPLLGLCTLSVHRRSGSSFLYPGGALFLVLFYWFLQSSILSYGKAGLISPFWAAFLLPLGSFICIFFAIRRVLN